MRSMIAVRDQVQEITQKLTFGCGCFSCEQNALALTKLYDLLKKLTHEEQESNRLQDSLTGTGRRKIGGSSADQ